MAKLPCFLTRRVPRTIVITRMLGGALILLCLACPAKGQVPVDSSALADSAKLLSEKASEAYGQRTREGLRQAIKLWHQASGLYLRLGDRGHECAMLNNIGVAHRLLGEADSSLVYYRQVLSIGREVGDRETEGTALGNIGHVHEGYGHPDSALVYYERALIIYRELGDRRAESKTIGSIGLAHRAVGRADSALAYLRQALAIQRELGDRDGEGKTLGNIGLLYGDMGRGDSALAYYGQVLAITRELGDSRGEAATLNNIGVVYRAQGRLDSALVHWQQALPVLQELGNRSGEAAVLGNVGILQDDLGRPDSALAYYRQALELFRELGDQRREGSTYNNIAVVYRNVGRSDSAIAYYGRALSVARDHGNRPSEGRTINNIGELYIVLGRPDSALAYHRQALEIYREVGSRDGMGGVLNNIGIVHRQLGRPDSALVYYRRALAIAEEVGDRSGQGLLLNNIGNIFADQGLPDSALAYLSRALAIHREVGDKRDEALALHNIGNAYLDLDLPDSALVYYGDALTIRRAVRSLGGESETLTSLGILYSFSRSPTDLAKAIAYFDTAAAVRASIAAHAGGDPNRLSYAEQYVKLFQYWALAWLAQAHAVGSERSARSALAAAERGRGQALLDLMRTSAGGAEGVVSPLQVLTTPGADLAAEGARLAEAVTRSGAAGLSYLMTHDTLLVWLVEASGDISVARRAVSRDSVVTLVRALRAGLGVDDPTAGSQLALRGALQLEAAVPVVGAAPLRRGVRYAEAAAAVLAELLLPAPLASRLPESGELVIVPHGALALVPFSALPLRGGEEGLVEPFGNRFAIRYAPSLATLEVAETRPGLAEGEERVGALKRAVLVGNPNMPGVAAATGQRIELARLPRTEHEVGWLAERLGARSLSGAEATESVIRKRLAESQLVHLATHGYAYSTEAWARESFVALAPDEVHDGLLTVGEILDDPILALSAELVVLSACQTGLGDLKEAEGTVGLQRAFLAKGARSVLVSLWSVSDAATEELMKRFYRHWLDDDDRPNKAEALRRAQEDVRATPGLDHPRFWAGFQLVGAR